MCPWYHFFCIRGEGTIAGLGTSAVTEPGAREFVAAIDISTRGQMSHKWSVPPSPLWWANSAYCAVQCLYRTSEWLPECDTLEFTASLKTLRVHCITLALNYLWFSFSHFHPMTQQSHQQWISSKLSGCYGISRWSESEACPKGRGAKFNTC